MVINKKGDSNLFVRRWAKRIIVDKKFNINGLKNYIEKDGGSCKGIEEKLFEKIQNRTMEGIDDL